jgi:hypothetical protein
MIDVMDKSATNKGAGDVANLIFCGFVLQSLQYWLALFDVHLT